MVRQEHRPARRPRPEPAELLAERTCRTPRRPPLLHPHRTAEGFIHCSPDEATTLAVVEAFYRDAPRPLLALVVDERRLTAECVFEEPVPAPPPGVADGVRFPHVFGPLNRDAVTAVHEVVWDADGHPTGLADHN